MSKKQAPPSKKIESESEESSEEVKPTPKAPVTTKAPSKTTPTPAKKTEESGSSSEESEEEVAKPVQKTPVVPAQKKAAKVPPTTATKKEESSEESESEEVKAKPATTKTPVKPTPVTPAKKVESEEESSEEEDEKPAKVAKPATTTPVTTKKGGKDESSEEESSEEIKRITPDDNPKGLKRKRDEVDNSTNKKRKIENGNGTNGGGSNGGGSVKLRLGNLSFELDGQVDEIKNQFSDCGEILNVEMIARQDGRWAGVVILEFANQDGANKALEMHDQDFWGRKMNISYPKESSRGGGGGFGGGFKNEVKEKPEGCNTVFIGNLNYQITEDEVKEFFSKCGDVRDVRWPKGEFKGYGWVEFLDTDAPDEAIKLAGQDLMGRAVRVDYAAPRKSNF